MLSLLYGHFNTKIIVETLKITYFIFIPFSQN